MKHCIVKWIVQSVCLLFAFWYKDCFFPENVLSSIQFNKCFSYSDPFSSTWTLRIGFWLPRFIHSIAKSSEFKMVHQLKPEIIESDVRHSWFSVISCLSRHELSIFVQLAHKNTHEMVQLNCVFVYFFFILGKNCSSLLLP